MFAATAIAIACGTPPDQEIQQAQGAIDAAKAVGADRYAAEEFTAAQNALKNANDAVAQRDHKLARNHALDARDRAQTAARQASDRKAAARVDADHAVGAAAAALAEVRTRLRAAENARTPARRLADHRRALASGEEAVQKARADFDRGEYLAAIESANAATPRLQALAREISVAPTAGPRRRR